MAKRVQRYRVSSTVMATLVGLTGELVVNLTRNSVHVHDGVTAGGFELARADVSNVPDASASAAGRMSTALFNELKTATAAIATVNAALTAETAARIAADGVVSTAYAAADTTIKTSVNAGRFAANGENVIMFVYQATVPTGWTFDGFDDALLMSTGTQANGGTSSGSWTITGFTLTIAQHALTIAEMPAHTHTYVPYSNVNSGTTGGGSAQLPLSPTTTSITGGGGAHGHAGSTITQNGAWRPQHLRCIRILRSTWGLALS